MSTRSETTLLITEVFHSIQGESTWAGVPCSFIRLARCHLRCRWCDTTYSFRGGAQREIDALIDEVAEADLPIVEVTGGEPLLQPNVYPLMQALVARGRPVLLETSGAVSIADVPREVHRIVDLKAPGSGECERNLFENLDHMTERDELKIVLADRADYEWAREIIGRFEGAVAPLRATTFSAVHGELDAAELASWIIEDRLPVRVGLQLHKFLWPEAEQGV